MDEFTKNHLKSYIKSRFICNQDEIFKSFIDYFNQLDADDKEYILNNSWMTLERQIENERGG